MTTTVLYCFRLNNRVMVANIYKMFVNMLPWNCRASLCHKIHWKVFEWFNLTGDRRKPKSHGASLQNEEAYSIDYGHLTRV